MTFNNSHNFGVGTANINVYQNHSPPSSVDPAKILRKAQAVEALHTSATVGYISKCHPGTREEVTTDIVDWVVGATGANQGSAPRKAMFWFSGPAGAGKTSIMRGVVDRCCAASGFSAASFFFSVRGSGVTTVRPFIATIVCQLVTLDPVLRPIIYDAIQDRPTIFEESLEEQIERVLVAPLQSPAFQSQSKPPNIVIAIDGLDECREEREREQLLDILHTLVTKLPRLIVIVIASRPEFDLRRAFARPKLKNFTESIKLHEYNGFDDIRVLVCDELEEIRQSHPLAGSIPEGWPFESIVQQFVDKCSGNFIVPVTAMKYIKTSRRNPVDSFNIILGVLKNPSPTSKPFAELDALYALILNPPEADPSLIKRILHCIIGVTAIGGINANWFSSYFLDHFLKLPPGTTATALSDLHSILHIPESIDEPIKFHHKTLEDYLLNSERSSDFFQSPYETQLDLAMLCATHITRWGSNPLTGPSDYIQYSVVYWGRHLKSCINQRPMSVTLPNIIMDLDPRYAGMYSFICGWTLDAIPSDLAMVLHLALCSKRHCVRLCQLVTRVNNCKDKCDAFDGIPEKYNWTSRLNALPRFKSETGLFAPLYPDSRSVFKGYGRAQLVRGAGLVDGDENGRLGVRDEHGQLDDKVKDSHSDTTGGLAIAPREGYPSIPPSRRGSLDREANFDNEEKGDKGEEDGKGSEEEEGGESVDDLMANAKNGQPNPPSRRESLNAEANFDDEGGGKGNEEEEGGEGGQSGDGLMANTMDGRPNPQSKWESLDEASPSTVPPPNDPPPPAVFDDEDEEFQPEASPSTLPPPSDNNLEAGTTGGRAGGSGGSAIVGHDGLGRPSNLPYRRESLAEASPSTFPIPAPPPQNLIVGPWRRLTAWIKRLFRRTHS